VIHDHLYVRERERLGRAKRERRERRKRERGERGRTKKERGKLFQYCWIIIWILNSFDAYINR